MLTDVSGKQGTHFRIEPTFGEGVVRCEKDDDQVDDELGDLEGGEMAFPPWRFGYQDGSRVVVVHDDMDEEVEDDGDPGDGGVALEFDVAEEGRHGVVVDVEEFGLLFFEGEEEGVDELVVFEEVVDVVEELETWSEGLVFFFFFFECI
jgi:hypothetical protein